MFLESEKRAVRDLALLKADGTPITDADNANPASGNGTPGCTPTNPVVMGANIISPGQNCVTAQSVMFQVSSIYAGLFSIQQHTDLPVEREGIPSTIDALRGTRKERNFLPSITAEWDILPDLSVNTAVRKANKLVAMTLVQIPHQDHLTVLVWCREVLSSKMKMQSHMKWD